MTTMCSAMLRTKCLAALEFALQGGRLGEEAAVRWIGGELDEEIATTEGKAVCAHMVKQLDWKLLNSWGMRLGTVCHSRGEKLIPSLDVLTRAGSRADDKGCIRSSQGRYQPLVRAIGVLMELAVIGLACGRLALLLRAFSLSHQRRKRDSEKEDV
jgi:hypothetical protein